MALKTKKNLIKTPTEYTRYYGDFRGVDFSSEQTEVHEQRFAYAVNMYRDYRNSEGNVIETFPGFRRVIEDANGRKINGIHFWKDHFFIHIGMQLYCVPKDISTIGVTKQFSFVMDEEYSVIFPENITVKEVKSVTVQGLTLNGWTASEGGITFESSTWGKYVGSSVIVNYTEHSLDDYLLSKKGYALIDGPSSFVELNNTLYLLDGDRLRTIKHDGDAFEVSVWSWDIDAYNEIGTSIVYKDIGASGTLNISEFEYEQKNLLHAYYEHTYVSRGKEEQEYPLYSPDKIWSIHIINNATLRSLGLNEAAKDENGNYPEIIPTDTYAIVESTDQARILKINMGNREAGAYTVSIKYVADETIWKSNLDKIHKCTIATVYDDRLFVTGNPNYPNTIWFCGYNNKVGIPDARYFGELDFIQDGYVGRISCLMTVSDTLVVMKSDANHEPSMYFHSRQETGESYIPVTYPYTSGLSGLGKIYDCTNFRDDPIFISKLGVEAVGQLSVRLERALEHRSYLIDGKLLPMDLSKAKLSEWENYLVVLCPDGKIFLGDSRQKYAHSTGVMQYEWYYLEDIGVYDDHEIEYYYSANKDNAMPETVTFTGQEYPLVLATNVYDVVMKTTNDFTFSPVKSSIYEAERPTVHTIIDENGKIIHFTIQETWDGQSYIRNGIAPLLETKAILCEDRGAKVGKGNFHPATSIFNLDGGLYFSTDNGIICKFNLDMKASDGRTPKSAYNFDGRTILSGLATKLDNCGIPHLTKSTIKKSMVLKTTSMYGTAIKIKVRTNRKGYENIARLSSNLFDFDDMDFSDFSFAVDDNPIMAIKEKEKHWVEKQHWIYSDEFEKPFTIHYLAFRYKVSGRIK